MSTHRYGGLTEIATVVAVLAGSAAVAAPPWLPEPRSIDGTGNNQTHPEWGSVGSQLVRLTTVAYDDGIASPGGVGRPSPRTISNVVCAQEGSFPNAVSATDYLWQWGQFIDHDITLVDPAVPVEPFNIPVPPGDEFFDPDGTGTKWILLDRSQWDPVTGTDLDNPRQQMGSITAFIDASQVYGSNPIRAAALRTLDGTGRLKTSPGNLLPFNLDGLPNFGGPDPSLFLAGDIRANEQAGLTSMHTLWMREHNRLAAYIGQTNQRLSGDEIYELARAIVGAEIQAITYKEFLPILIGPEAIPPYAGYDPTVNAGIANIFATAAYRVGHTLLSPMIMRLDADGATIPEGHLALLDAFFAPDVLTDEGGVEPILRGLAAQPAQEVDTLVVDAVRNFLFGLPGEGGFDLVSLNLQRGRDHGLPGYNQTRLDLGLAPAEDFGDISSSPAVAGALLEAYGDVDLVDVWVGGIAEDHVDGALVGELLRAIIGDQFRRLRDGDRFWYQNTLHGPLLAFVESVRLSDVIRANTQIDDEIPDDVFRLAGGCAADINGDGVVDALDLREIVAAWGSPGGPADVDGDGVVGVLDLLFVISRKGPC
jgi:hypothetical protein